MQETKEVRDLLSKSIDGLKYLMILQFITRILIFVLNEYVLNYVSIDILSIVTINMELLYSTILFLSREGFRSILIRSENNEQIGINLAYIPTCFGFFVTVAVSGYYYRVADISIPYYQTSILLYGLSCFIELLIEPIYILSMNRLYFKLRFRIEIVAIFLKFLFTMYFIRIYNNLLVFSIAQLIFSSTFMMGYLIFIIKNGYSVIPHKVNGSWFDQKLLNLGITMIKQSLLKHLLIEGDKILITVLCSIHDKNMYAIAMNYGSLIVRVLFQPIEETQRTFYSKLNNKSFGYDVLLGLIRFHVLFGLVFVCILANLFDNPVFIAYAIYIPFMGFNGLTENLFQSIATKSQLKQLNYFMMLFSICFVSAGFFFIYWLKLGVLGLILSNMLNLSIRIYYYWYHIKSYFSITTLSKKEWLPNYITLSSFAASWLITFLFKQQYITITVFLAHIGIMLWKEKDTLNIFYKQHEKVE